VLVRDGIDRLEIHRQDGGRSAHEVRDNAVRVVLPAQPTELRCTNADGTPGELTIPSRFG
jgi:hypothetical protein